MSMSMNTNMNMNMIQIPSNFGMPSPNDGFYGDISSKLRSNIDSGFLNKLEKASGAIASKFPEINYPEITKFEIKNEPILQVSSSIPSNISWDIPQTQPLNDFIPKPIDFNVLTHIASQEKILGVQSGSLQTKFIDLNKPMEIPSIDNYLSKPSLDFLNKASSSIASKFPEPDYSDIYKNIYPNLNNINTILPRNDWIEKPKINFNDNYSSFNSFENDSWNRFGLNKKPDLSFNDNSNNWDIINNLNKPEPVKYLDLNSNNDVFNKWGLDKKPDLSFNDNSNNWNIISDLNKSKPVNDYSYKPVFIDLNKPKTVNDYSSFKNNNVFKNLDLDETPTYNNYSGLNDDPLKGFKFLDINVKPEIKIPDYTTNYLNIRNDNLIDNTLKNLNKPGLFNPQPFQYGYDLPETKTQFHFHGADDNHLAYGKLKDYEGNTLFEEKNSFNLAINDLMYHKGGFKRFP